MSSPYDPSKSGFGLDNQYFPEGCPPMMSDGRIYASYVSSQVLVDAIRRANGLDTCKYDNNDFRQFMIRNANSLMQQERKYMVDHYQCHLPKRPIHIELPFER